MSNSKTRQDYMDIEYLSIMAKWYPIRKMFGMLQNLKLDGKQSYVCT